MNKSTAGSKYTNRLAKLEYRRWKSLLHVQAPYIWHLHHLKPGKTLDIGCGIGRYLKVLPGTSVGIDHNRHSIDYACSLGLTAFTNKEFEDTKYNKNSSYDSILLSHILEHLSEKDSLKLLRTYIPLLKQNGKVIIFCPQERGYASDSTHVTFMDHDKLRAIAEAAGLKVIKASSFPLVRSFGKTFKYNEFTLVAQRI